MASSSNTPRFVTIVPQTWHPSVMLLVLWPSYLKHGLLELCSSFYGHHTSNMASSRYTTRFVSIIPQTLPPRVMLLVLWPSYLKHDLLELCSSCHSHHTLNMASSSYIRVLWPPYLKHGLYELYLFKIDHQKCSKTKIEMNCYLIG